MLHSRSIFQKNGRFRQHLSSRSLGMTQGLNSSYCEQPMGQAIQEINLKKKGNTPYFEKSHQEYYFSDAKENFHLKYLLEIFAKTKVNKNDQKVLPMCCWVF